MWLNGLSFLFQMLKYVGPEGGQLKANLTSTGANIMVTQVSYGAFNTCVLGSYPQLLF